MDMIGYPQNANAAEEGKYHLIDRFMDAFCEDKSVEYLFEGVDIQVDHSRNEFIDQSLMLGFCIGEGDDLVFQLLLGHSVYMGNLVPIFVKKGNVENGL